MVEFILIAYFFSFLISSLLAKKVIKLAIIPFLLLILVDFLIIGNREIHNYPTIIEFLTFMIIIIFYLFEKMRFDLSQPIYLTINFWLSVGLLVYFAGNFFYVMLAESSNNHTSEIRNDLAFISSSITLIKNIILSISFTIKEPQENLDEYDFKIPLEINLDSFTPSNNLK